MLEEVDERRDVTGVTKNTSSASQSDHISRNVKSRFFFLISTNPHHPLAALLSSELTYTIADTTLTLP